MHLQHPHPKESPWWAFVLLLGVQENVLWRFKVWNTLVVCILICDMSEYWIPHVVQKNYSWNRMLNYCVPPYLFSSLYANLGMSVCNRCLFLTQYSLQQYNLHELWLQSSEVLLCLWKAFLKHTWKCIIWLLQLRLMLILRIFWIWSSFSMDSWRTRRGKLITTFNSANTGVNICCFKAFSPAFL